jgi:hypothetical protein
MEAVLSDLKHLFLSRQNHLAISKFRVSVCWVEGDCCLEYVPKPCLTFVANLILLDWPIVCLQEVFPFDIIVKNVFMLSRSHKCSHDLEV